MTILEFDNVSKRYGKQEVLSDINFKLESNRIIGLLGPNGSGKTTIMKMIGNLITPTGGKIVKSDEFKIKTQVEEPSFYRDLSGLDNLLYLTANEENVTKEDILNVVERLNMESYIKKKTGKYSMGMRGRLSIAYMLIGDADLIVLDEPLNGLDPLAVIEVRDLLKELTEKKGVTIFISSHILKELQCICDEVIILNKGRIIKHTNLQDVDVTLEIEYETENDCIKGCEIIGAKSTSSLTSELKIDEKTSISSIIKQLIDEDVKIIGVKKNDNIIEEIYCESIAGCENVKG